MKYHTSHLIFILACALLPSCGNNNDNHQTDEVTIVSTIVKKTYPYRSVDTKKEQNSGDYNEMSLYACGDNPNVDTLKSFCSDKKSAISGGIFYIVVFFDKEENAVFPNNPFTAGFVDEGPSKHIKAVYTYNRLNGYSKLDYYDKNPWESASKSYEIN